MYLHYFIIPSPLLFKPSPYLFRAAHTCVYVQLFCFHKRILGTRHQQITWNLQIAEIQHVFDFVVENEE